ncbi:hypothetical protein [Pseudomonas sp. PSKL.D1]|uniref:hypothetical protein n=1 Tax=Pseudomonas sp. PSKL.D1 TaxID=3029060 RepID=UPI0023816DB3|nr:hypothetical protein [Pseudomonas sp. PSKL.D1]WDY56894.1 hypothetical protein PVV54_20280 [Pseudomonas sp. PSKL.D1]
MYKLALALGITFVSACSSINTNQIEDEQLVNKPMALITHPYTGGQPSLPSTEAPLTFTIVDTGGTYTLQARDNKDCWKIDGDASITAPSRQISFSNLTFYRTFTCSNSIDNNTQENAFDLLKMVRQYEVAQSTGKVQLKDQAGRPILWFQFVAEPVRHR